MDLEVEDAPMLEQLQMETIKRLQKVFGVDSKEVKSFVHYPYVEQLSTFHIHFKYKLPDRWSNSSQYRVSPSLDDVINKLKTSPLYYRDHREFDGIGGQPAHILSILNACSSRNNSVRNLLRFDRAALVFGQTKDCSTKP